MSDLADTIDDLICSFESDGKTMDTLIMYLFCWALVGFFALAVGKFAYGRAVGYAAARNKSAATAAAAAKTAESDPAAASDRKQPHHRAAGIVPPTPPVARKRLGSKTGRTASAAAAVAGVAAGLSAVPAAAAANRAFSFEQQQAAAGLPPPHHHQRPPPPPPPAAAGNDPDAVRWTNELFRWLYEVGGTATSDGPPVVEHLLGEWIRSLNEYTKKSFAEVSPPLCRHPSPWVAAVFLPGPRSHRLRFIRRHRRPIAYRIEKRPISFHLALNLDFIFFWGVGGYLFFGGNLIKNHQYE